MTEHQLSKQGAFTGPHMRPDGSSGKDRPDHGDTMYDALVGNRGGGRGAWLQFDERDGQWHEMSVAAHEQHLLGTKPIRDTIHGDHGPAHLLPKKVRAELGYPDDAA